MVFTFRGKKYRTTAKTEKILFVLKGIGIAIISVCGLVSWYVLFCCLYALQG